MTFPPSPEPLTDVSRVLAVFAHPDDVDFSSAGTIATWVDQGIDVSYLLVTRGDSGGFDDTPREQMPIIREAEQRAAAATVGVKQVEFLDGYVDGRLYVTHELRRDISRVIRRVRPDRVLTNSPLRNWSRLAGPSHPDHLAAGEATTCAVYPDARNPFAHPELLNDEGLEPWTVREVWYSGGPNPDHFVDVTDTFERKLEALWQHVSQTAANRAELSERLRTAFNTLAKMNGLGPDRYAEAFSIVRSS